MATNQIPKESLTARRAKLTTKLKKEIGEYDALITRSGKLRNQIYLDSYKWVELFLLDNPTRTQQNGIKRLAATLRLGPSRINDWYVTGRFIFENKLQDADHRTSHVIAVRQKSLPKHAVLKAVSDARKGVPHATVRRYVLDQATTRQAGAQRRATRLKNKGELTLRFLKMEVLAFRTLIKKFYGKREVAIHVIVVDEVTGEEIRNF